MRVHLCVYHSQYPLLLRSAMERQLDTLLDRRGGKEGENPALQRPALRALIDARPESHHLFIVLGSPVTEVGRDHDYDWAVVEPSSMRSLIQLAGRVRRHRPGAVTGVNMVVLDSNLRRYEHPGQAAFCKPGFEMDDAPFRLKTHELHDLLVREMQGVDPAAWRWPVDAQPRITLPPGGLHRSSLLVDLEHGRMYDAMLPKAETPPKRNASLHWAHPGHLWLTGLLPQYQRFRHDTQPREEVVFLSDEDETALHLHRVADGQRRGDKLYTPVHDGLCNAVPDGQLNAPSVSPWLRLSLLDELTALAQAQGMSLQKCAEHYATANLPRSELNGWWFHETLGFAVKK